MYRVSFLPAISLASLLISGCGDGHNVKVGGKLLKGGVKYSPPTGHNLTITFVAIDAQDADGKPVKDEPFQALLNAGGESFFIPGREGYGIPPGKYRVAVTQRMSREAFEASKPKAAPGMPPITRETDFLYDRFGPEKSPIIREIKGGEDLVIDLDKPE